MRRPCFKPGTFSTSDERPNHLAVAHPQPYIQCNKTQDNTEYVLRLAGIFTFNIYFSQKELPKNMQCIHSEPMGERCDITSPFREANARCSSGMRPQ